MKLYRIGVILLFLLVLSIGAVCAADADNSTVELADNSELSINEKTYTDLDVLVNSSTSATIDIKDDYKYDDKTDNITVIKLVNDSRQFVLEGNNHVIDGGGVAGLFSFNGVNVTLKNLVIKNCNGSALLVSNANLTMVNLTFVNNSRAVSALHSTIISRGDTFGDNHAKYGSSIFVFNSKLDAKDDMFVSSIPSVWAMVYSQSSKIEFERCVFANTTSRYATAIYNDYITTVKKSKFINLAANLTAGAIAIKTSSNKGSLTLIEDCDFINVSSFKNGGAIFADVAGDSNYNGSVILNNSRFSECESMFGAALLQLGGDLIIESSSFEDNLAYLYGGAVYTSYVTLKIYNSNFTNNLAGYDGGAIYADVCGIVATNNSFVSNNASGCGGMYLYCCQYEITKSNFKDNGEAIVAFLDGDGSYQKENNFARDKVTLGQKYYATYVDFEGKEIVLNPLKIEGSANDTYFNLAKQGLVTPVRDQGNMGACWAFGIAGALESSFLIATNISLDISENNIQGIGIKYSKYGFLEMSEAGTYDMGSGYFLSWLGVVSTEYDEYDELGKVTPVIFENGAYHILEAVYANITDSKALKEVLTTYGAMSFFINGAVSNSEYYNPKTHALYYNGDVMGNHYVTLVGWDDNYSASNFLVTPPGDGAWICKNSWGSDWGEDGYFYISYYDNSLKVGVYAVGFVINNTQLYNKVYQYDVLGFSSDYHKFINGYGEYMNKFVSLEDDLLAAVGTYFEYAGSDYTITVYVDGAEVYSQNGTSRFSGFNTIKLDRTIYLHQGAEFSVKIKSVSMPLVYDTRMPFEANTSFADFGNGMVDLIKEGLITSVKAYTIENPIELENIHQTYSPTRKFVAYSELEGAVLSLLENGKVIATAAVKNGMADFGIVLDSGRYTLLNPYNGSVIVTAVEIAKSIVCDDEITIGYLSRYSFSPLFVDDCGNPLSGFNITVVFDDEEVIVKTDDAGKLPLTIYKGNTMGKHSFTLTNPVTGESKSVTIYIISRIEGASNINMYYFDGSALSLNIVGNDAYYVDAQEVVTVKIGSKTFNVETDDDGEATLKIPSTITPGSYVMTISYAGQSVKKTLKVKQVLKSSKTVSVKKSAKKLVLKATLKGKSALKNKVVKFKVNGKTYSGKTNSKGIAKVTIKKSAIKKLKAGKKYTIKITYLKDTIKSTLKVKR